MKNKNLIGQLLVWLTIFGIVLALGLYVRFYPLRAHVWSDASEQATVLVLSKLRMIVVEQVAAEFPAMTQAQRNELIEQRFANLVHTEAPMVRKTIAQAAQNLRGQSPDGGDRVYLQEADGYYYLDLTQNIIKTGKIAQKFDGSKYLNEKMAAPFGFWQPVNVHPYVGVFLYKAISAFKPGISLVEALSFTGPILSALTLAAFVTLCFILRLSPLASLVGAAYFYLAPIFVKRSTFAWYDDDSYNLLFPLLILCVIFHAFKVLKTRRHAIVYGLITALLFALYALFWHGWGFTFAVVIVGGFLIWASNTFMELTFKPHVSSKDKIKNAAVADPHLLVFFAVVFIGAIALVSVMFGVGSFFILLDEGFTGLKKLTVNQLSMWPNLFVAVGELKRSSLTGIMHMTGNPFSFLGALLSVPLLGYIAFNRRDRVRIFGLIILTVLLAADMKITLGAERFILLCLIPLAVLFTMGLSSLIDLLRGIIHPIGAVPERPNLMEISIGVVLAAVAVFFPVRSINAQIPELLNPIFNVTWEAALLDIKQKTPPDAVVTSWWPPGHFIKAIADRRVTFDGATLGMSKESYWVANILLTSDERKAASILRMLNISGTTSVDYLQSLGLKTSDAVSLLHFILPQTKTEAAAFLRKVLPQSVDKLLTLTHGAPPPSYLLIYSELMEKNIGLQFVGKWNFKQIEDLNKDPQALKKVPPANSPEFFEFMWKTIGGAYKYSEALISIAQDGGNITFDKGLSLDLTTMTVSMRSTVYGTGTPASIVYFDGNKVVEKKFSGRNLSYSVVLFQENSRYYCRLMDQELANSMLVKFFVFKGKGLEFFKPLTLQKGLSGRDEVDVFELQREKLK
jgi:asparagine N-glycosylation enzyme membrane subunit Stt3